MKNRGRGSIAGSARVSTQDFPRAAAASVATDEDGSARVRTA